MELATRRKKYSEAVRDVAEEAPAADRRDGTTATRRHRAAVIVTHAQRYSASKLRRISFADFRRASSSRSAVRCEVGPVVSLGRRTLAARRNAVRIRHGANDLSSGCERN